MDILVQVVLPISLAVIMFSLGLGLQLADFTRVLTRKKAFLAGALCQVVLLPITAFCLALAFGLTGELAAGVMLLSFCPSGTTSNVLTRLARGDVALSVSLTALISLLSFVTIPVLAGLSVRYFMGEAAPEFSVFALALVMFALVVVPVLLGLGLRSLAPGLVARIEGLMMRLSMALFAIIVVAAIASNWALFVENLARLGPATASLVVITLGLGLLVGTLLRLDAAERATITIEAGIQNSTLAISTAPLIVGLGVGLPEMALPAAIHGVLMYTFALPLVALLRSRAGRLAHG
ncbi:MAG: bile acid:sodium symporter [Pseudomonadota bacterium]